MFKPIAHFIELSCVLYNDMQQGHFFFMKDI